MLNWRNRVCYEGEGVGGGGTVVPPVVVPPPATPAPIPEDATRAQLRADLAAERIARGNLERTSAAEAERLRGEVAAAKDEAETKVTAKVTEVTTKLTKMQQRVVDAELRGAAAEFGLLDQDLLQHPLLDRSKIAVDDEGVVTGVKEAFEALKVKKAEWFKAATAEGPVVVKPRVTGAATTTTTTTAAPTKAKDMSEADYKAFKATQLRNLRLVS